MSIQFNFATYNIKQRFEESSAYPDGNIEKANANSLSAQADVICLQGVGNTEREFITQLQENGFWIYHPYNLDGSWKGSTHEVGTAVAIKALKFSSIQNLSMELNSSITLEAQDIASISATPDGTAAPIQFSSVFSKSFKIFKPHHQKKFSQIDLKAQGQALDYTEEVLKSDQCTRHLIGADMNNNPQNYSVPFNQFKRAQFSVLNPNKSTFDQSLAEGREFHKTDFIMAKGFTHIKNVWQRFLNFLKRIFYLATPQMTISQPKIAREFSFDKETNCSDHLPVISTVKIVSQSKFQHFLKSLKKAKKTKTSEIQVDEGMNPSKEHSRRTTAHSIESFVV